MATVPTSTSPRRKNSLRILVAGCACLAFAFADEGRLAEFESGFSEKNSSSDSSPAASGDDPGFFGHLLVDFLSAGGTSANQFAQLRPEGHPVVPVAQVDVGGMWIDSNTRAVDVGLRAGYGFLAVEGRWTEFTETDPDDRLGFGQAHLLYRMATDSLEIGVGLGAASLKGEQTRSSASATLPLRYWPSKNWGLELRPAWTAFNGVGLTDIDTAILYRRDHLTVSLGYRWIRGDADVRSLSGVRVGIGARY